MPQSHDKSTGSQPRPRQAPASVSGVRRAARRVRPLIALALLILLCAGTFALANPYGAPVHYTSAGGGTFTSVRPTGVGLPQIGESGTVAAGDFTAALRRYHDSGAYERDLATVAGAAKTYLNQRLAAAHAPPKRVCTVRYRAVKVPNVNGPLYTRSRSCRKLRAAGLSGKPAIVLDIDETALSNYAGLAASNFTDAGLDESAVKGDGTAIEPTLDLYQDARDQGVAVFFITGRPSAIDATTKANLRSAGYNQGWNALYDGPTSTGVEAFKSTMRAKIETSGFDIVVNLGDQESDLDGGHADRAFKLPDPFYFVGD